MAEVKWIRIVTDIFDDEKILLIEQLPQGDSLIVIWFKLLCFAGKQNNGGVFMLNDRIAYTDEMLATIFRRPLTMVRLALETFEQFGMIAVIDGAITIPKWELHQNIEGLDKIREQTRQRVARHRDKQKQIAENVTLPVTLRNATDKDIDKELDKDTEGEEGYISNIQGQQKNPSPAPPIEPLQTAYQTDIDEIIATWNAQSCTHKIDKIPFGGRRYSNTMICINNNLPNFLLTIKDLDNQAWFADRAKRHDPLKYDWFIDPNNYIKVVEGNYRDLRQAEHRETDQERALRMIEEATE